MMRHGMVWQGCLWGICLGLTGCQVQPPPANQTDDVHQQLIGLKLDDLLPLEQSQRYAALSDQMDVPEAHRAGRRAQFLKLTKCAETVLGPVTQVSRSRAVVKQVKPQLFTVTLPVSRANASVLEQWTFISRADGTLQWTGLHWLTNRSDFLTCASTVPGLVVRQPKKPASAQPATKVNGKEAATTQPTPAKPAVTPSSPSGVMAASATHAAPPAKPHVATRIKHALSKPVNALVNKVKPLLGKPEPKPDAPPPPTPEQPTPKTHDSDTPLSHTKDQQQQDGH